MNTELFEAGLRTRREVLGDAYVDASLAAATEFSKDMQEFVTQYCWGDLWNRPGLARRDRSLVNLGMISALNRPTEFKTHVRGAVNNGVTKAEITEVLLQVAVYCGAPAALEAFRLADEVFRVLEAESAAASAAESAAASA